MNVQAIALEKLDPSIIKRCWHLARRGGLEFQDLCQQSRMLLCDFTRLVVSAANARTEELREARFTLLESIRNPATLNPPPDRTAEAIVTWVTGLAADDLRPARVLEFSMDDPDNEAMSGNLAAEVAMLTHAESPALDELQEAIAPIIGQLASEERVRFVAGLIRRAPDISAKFTPALAPGEADSVTREIHLYQAAAPKQKNTMNQQFSRSFKKVRTWLARLAPVLVAATFIGIAASSDRAAAATPDSPSRHAPVPSGSDEEVDTRGAFKPKVQAKSKQNASRVSASKQN